MRLLLTAFSLVPQFFQDLQRVEKALLKRTVDESPPPVSPVRRGKKYVPVPLLKFVLILGHVTGGKPTRTGLRVRVCVPVVEDLECERLC